MTAQNDISRVVRSWIREEDGDSADRIVEIVLGGLDTTPQRRSWWPARRYSEMSASAKLLAAAVLLGVALAGTAFVVSGGIGPTASATPPPASTPVPTVAGPATTVGPTPVAILEEFTACMPGNTMFKQGTTTEEIVPGASGDIRLEKARGTTYKGTITATDPRFSGTHYYIWTGNTYSLAGGDGPHSYADAMRIENDDGAWRGSSFGVELQDGTNTGSITVLKGEGAYNGITAGLLVAEGPCFFNWRGVVGMEIPESPVPATDG